MYVVQDSCAKIGKLRKIVCYFKRQNERENCAAQDRNFLDGRTSLLTADMHETLTGRGADNHSP